MEDNLKYGRLPQKMEDPLQCPCSLKMTPLCVDATQNDPPQCPCSLKMTPLYVHATNTESPQSPHLIPDVSENLQKILRKILRKR